MSVEVKKAEPRKYHANQEQVNNLIRSLLEKVAELKDDVTKKNNEIEDLKSRVADVDRKNFGAKAEDDLEMDGAWITRESFGTVEKKSMPPLRSVPVKRSRDVACSTDNMPAFASLDHSSCCSREISLKLMEQNKALQKKLREILNLKGSSIDEYLKCSYNEDRLNSKIKEIEQLKKQLEASKKDNNKNNLEMNTMKKELEEKNMEIMQIRTLFVNENKNKPEVQKLISNSHQKSPPSCSSSISFPCPVVDDVLNEKKSPCEQLSPRHTGDQVLETDGSKGRACPNCEKMFRANESDEYKRHVQKCDM